VSKGLLSEKKFVKNDSNAPNVDLVAYLRIGLLEALRRLVPIGPYSLGRQLNFFEAFVNCLAQAKISNLDFAVVENYILRF